MVGPTIDHAVYGARGDGGRLQVVTPDCLTEGRMSRRARRHGPHFHGRVRLSRTQKNYESCRISLEAPVARPLESPRLGWEGVAFPRHSYLSPSNGLTDRSETDGFRSRAPRRTVPPRPPTRCLAAPPLSRSGARRGAGRAADDVRVAYRHLHPRPGPPRLRVRQGHASPTRDGRQVAGDGVGQTIAVIDPYDDPNIAVRPVVLRRQLPPAHARRGGQAAADQGPHGQRQRTSPGRRRLAQEIALDVEWAHAIAPSAHILLVEARSDVGPPT